MSSSVKACKNCILTEEDSKTIVIDENGTCNYCNNYEKLEKSLGSPEEREAWLRNKVSEIKKQGANKKYDCILGVSGGVDSTYLAYWASQNNLRPLVIHFDNGWNTELATQNIQNICGILKYDLNTYVINWDEFRELQVAYLKAGVVDIEVLTDHAIYATLLEYAKKYNIKYILSGFNYVTEAIMPKDWVFDKRDWENIKDIYSQYGSGGKLKTFPHISFAKKISTHYLNKLESVQVLNYIRYNKAEAKEIISKNLNWIDYGGKHHESVFTRFYQIYILPKKFGIDKRKAHLATLICSGQTTKDKALQELAMPAYDVSAIEDEKQYVIKK